MQPDALRSPLRLSFEWPFAQKHRFCHLCGRRLYGSYVRYDNGLVICPRCQSEAPHCDGCGIPSRSLQAISIGDVSIIPGRKTPPAGLRSLSAGRQSDNGKSNGRYCPQCVARMPQCSACSQPIATTFIRVGDSPETYCPQCMAQRPHCDVCGAPLGPGSQALRDGQSRCAACAASAVYQEAEVQQLYRQVIQTVTATLGLRIACPPELRVVARRELNQVRVSFSRLDPVTGPTPHLLGFFAQRGSRTTIYVEHALPRGLLIGTLAHEFGHAWQAEHCPQHQSEFRREGFAEWVSYHVLLALGYERDAARATRREDIYGRGLRHFIAIEQRATRADVLADARRP